MGPWYATLHNRSKSLVCCTGVSHRPDVEASSHSADYLAAGVAISLTI